jgi:signal peptidase I
MNLPVHRQQPLRAILTRRRLTLGLALSLVAVAAVMFARSISIYAIESASMEPTLHCSNAPGCRAMRPNRIVVSALPYLIAAPRRGDIVVLSRHGERGRCYGDPLVKRIVAVPGETIAQTHGKMRINGQPDAEPYLPSGARPGPDFAPVRLRSNQYFVMGDHRSKSCDSRQFGPVTRSALRGKVILVR